MIEMMLRAVSEIGQGQRDDLHVYAVDWNGVERLFALNEKTAEKIEKWSAEPLRCGEPISVSPILLSARLHIGNPRLQGPQRLAASYSHVGYVSNICRFVLPIHADKKAFVNELGLSFAIVDKGVLTGVIQTTPQTVKCWESIMTDLAEIAKEIGEPRRPWKRGDTVLLPSTARGNVFSGMSNRTVIRGTDGVQDPEAVAARISSLTKGTMNLCQPKVLS